MCDRRHADRREQDGRSAADAADAQDAAQAEAEAALRLPHQPLGSADPLQARRTLQ